MGSKGGKGTGKKMGRFPKQETFIFGGTLVKNESREQ